MPRASTPPPPASAGPGAAPLSSRSSLPPPPAGAVPADVVLTQFTPAFSALAYCALAGPPLSTSLRVLNTAHPRWALGELPLLRVVWEYDEGNEGAAGAAGAADTPGTPRTPGAGAGAGADAGAEPPRAPSLACEAVGGELAVLRQLARLGGDLDAGLAGDKLAEVEAYTALILGELRVALDAAHYWDAEHWEAVGRKELLAHVPFPLNHFAAWKARRDALDALAARLPSDEARRDPVRWARLRAAKAYALLEARLGENVWFLGTRGPTSLDALLFGHLAEAATVPLVDHFATDFPQLDAFVKRVLARVARCGFFAHGSDALIRARGGSDLALRDDPVPSAWLRRQAAAAAGAGGRASASASASGASGAAGGGGGGGGGGAGTSSGTGGAGEKGASELYDQGARDFLGFSLLAVVGYVIWGLPWPEMEEGVLSQGAPVSVVSADE